MAWHRLPILLVLAVPLMGARCTFPIDQGLIQTIWPGCLDLGHGMDGDVDAVYEYGRVRAKVWGESSSGRAWRCPIPVDPLLVYHKSVFTFTGRNVNLTKANGASRIDWLGNGFRVTYEVAAIDSAAQPYWGVPEVYANDLVVTHEIESAFAFAGQAALTIPKTTKTLSLVDWERQEFVRPYQEQWARFVDRCYDLNLSPTGSCLELMARCQETLGLNWDGCIQISTFLACEHGHQIVWFLSRPYYICTF